MHLFYCDESNMQKRDGDFLIYGGLAVEAEQAYKLSLAIDELRKKHKVPRDYILKFNPGPESFSHEQFIALKKEAMQITIDHGAWLVAYVILHDIAKTPDKARRGGINAVCYHFNCILNRIGGPGLVLIDRFNDKGNEIDSHLREKFTVGLTGMPYSSEIRLSNIIGFHYSAVGQAHLPSLVDIALGSLRFAVNAHTCTNKDKIGTAQVLLETLSPMFWKYTKGGPVPELSFMFSPKVIKVPQYRAQYQALKTFLAENGIVTEQPITNERLY